MTEHLPETMIAAVIDETGPAENLTLREVPLPATFISELLVRVEYSSVNPIDVKTRAGGGTSAGLHYPAILGNDFAGVVVRAPYEAHPLQPGTRVYGMTNVPRLPGSSARYVAVPSMSVAAMPATLDFAHAAAVPLAALTAWGALHDVAAVSAGDRVLIHAGAGGVGHFAVQFAAHRGAHVIATGSAGNADFLRSLGAAQVVDYRSERFEEVVDPVDVVLDLIGNVHDDTGTRSLGVVKPGGLLINVPSGSWPTLIADATAAGVRATTYKLAPSAAALQQIMALIDAGELHVEIAAEYPLEAISEAHRALEAGHTRGKIVVRMPS